MTEKNISLALWFDESLAKILLEKILQNYPEFNSKKFENSVKKNCDWKTLTQRVELICDFLYEFLPKDYEKSIEILQKSMWEENPNETWMFKEFYRLMPVWKFIEKYWIDYPETSFQAMEELTKRCTAEWAIRPFIIKYPEKTLKFLKKLAKSDNFHLRRLASEWIRPKLPWAKKLEIFLSNPKPVFEILEILKNDEHKYVMKSVWNNLADYLKLNPEPTLGLLKKWEKDASKNTLWIIKHAKRNFKD